MLHSGMCAWWVTDAAAQNFQYLMIQRHRSTIGIHTMAWSAIRRLRTDLRPGPESSKGRKWTTPMLKTNAP